MKAGEFFATGSLQIFFSLLSPCFKSEFEMSSKVKTGFYREFITNYQENFFIFSGFRNITMID